LAVMDRERYRPTVISLMGGGVLKERFEALGIPVLELGMSPGRPSPMALWRLWKMLRRIRPELIQGWMYHGNLAASLGAGLLQDRIPVIWNVRQTIYDLAKERRLSRLVIKAGTHLSGKPRRILYNSRLSAEQHERQGYHAAASQVIPNGFDLARFSVSEEARGVIRRELGITDETPLVGLVNRFHPMKDHAGFFKAAWSVLEKRPDSHFVLAGRGVSRDNEAFLAVAGEAAEDSRFHLLGERGDIPRLLAALDVSVSASAWGEGFSNTIGESMCCGVPCVVTDVGDSAHIVGEHGSVVPVGNPQALADAIVELLGRPAGERLALGLLLRQRVETEFSITRIAEQYTELYDSVS